MSERIKNDSLCKLMHELVVVIAVYHAVYERQLNALEAEMEKIKKE